MNRILFFLCFFIYSQFLVAQLIDSRRVLFDDKPFFNPSWVKGKFIREINGKISFKRDNQPIRKSSHTISFSFDRQGKMIAQIERKSVRNRMDTSEKYFEYDDKNNILRTIHRDHYGYYALNYCYDNSNYLTCVRHSRVQKRSSLEFVDEELVWADSVSEVRNNENSIQVFYNSLGKRYKKITRKFDSNGFVLQIRESYDIGGGYDQWDFVRNEKGEILKYYHITNSLPDVFSMTRYYDDSGRVTKEEYYSNDELVKLRRIEYDSSGRMILHLLRDISQRNMFIYEFNYERY